MKHKNAHNWQKKWQAGFFKLMIPKIQIQRVSNGSRTLRIKTRRQYDVPRRYDPFSKCQLQLQIWNTSSEDMLKKTGDILDDRDEASRTTEKEASTVVTKKMGAKGPHKKTSLQKTS